MGEIDIARARAGKELFAQECVGCHGPHISKPYKWPVANNGTSNPANLLDVNWQWDMAGEVVEENGLYYRKDWREKIWAMPMVDINDIGTDGKLASNYIETTYDATKIIPNSAPVNAGDGLLVLLNRLVPVLYQRWDIAGDQVANYDGLNIPFRVVNKKAYKSRPLHGVWATPPFLHNGSIPTIYDLLSPLNERPSTFYVGNREYNPKKLGYETAYAEGSFHHDTSIEGNRNTGHLFTDTDARGRIGKRLTEKQKMALIEYIKIMGNPDFSERIGGDDLNWDNYSQAPKDANVQAACTNAHTMPVNGSVEVPQ